MLRTHLLPTFNGIEAGKRATSELTLGKRYHVIWLIGGDDGTASAGNANDIEATLANLWDEIRLKIGGQVQREFSPVELNRYNTLNDVNGAFAAKSTGTAGTAGYRVYLPIYLAEPWRRGYTLLKGGAITKQSEIPSWNASGISSFQSDVKVNSGIVDPVLDGFYEWDELTGDIGIITKMTRHSFPAVGSKGEYNNLDKGTSDFLHSIHFGTTSDGKYITDLKFTANGVEIQETITTEMNQAKLLGREMNPDTSATPRYDAVLDYDDPITGLALANLKELTARVNFNAAANGTLPALIVRSGTPD